MTRILIVEDSKVVVERLKNDLIDLGYIDVVVTSNGEEAFGITKKNQLI